MFLETLGPEYLDLAYHAARDADPGARLVVNEYDVELDAPEQEARRVALLHLLERMRGSGTPVDAVGIQAHLTAVGGPPFSAPLLRRFLAEIAGLIGALGAFKVDCANDVAIGEHKLAQEARALQRLMPRKTKRRRDDHAPVS